MGLLVSCCNRGGGSTDFVTPDMETRRRQQAEAAERRMKDQEHRGIKDPEKVRRMQKKAEELEQRERTAGNLNDAPLKWQMS